MDIDVFTSIKDTVRGFLSRAVLQEHVDFLLSQIGGVERDLTKALSEKADALAQIRDLETQIGVLDLKATKLELENVKLKGELDELKQPQSPRIEEGAMKILETLCDRNGLTIHELCRATGMPESDVRYHVGELHAAKDVYAPTIQIETSMGAREIPVTIDQSGRRKVMQRRSKPPQGRVGRPKGY